MFLQVFKHFWRDISIFGRDRSIKLSFVNETITGSRNYFLLLESR